jgi:hypothetical protein
MIPGSQLASSACWTGTPARVEYMMACGNSSIPTDDPAIASPINHFGEYPDIHWIIGTLLLKYLPVPARSPLAPRTTPKPTRLRFASCFRALIFVPMDPMMRDGLDSTQALQSPFGDCKRWSAWIAVDYGLRLKGTDEAM